MDNGEPFNVEGIDYSSAGIEHLRQELITWRADMMTQGSMYHVTVITHVIGLLAYLGELQTARGK